MKKILFTVFALLFIAASCEKDPLRNLQLSSASSSNREIGPSSDVSTMQMMSIYCDGQMYSARVRELTALQAQTELAHAPAVRTIYIAPTLSPNNGLAFWFYPVLDNIRYTTTSALYIEKKVNYDSRLTRPEQFTSDEQIINATLVPNAAVSVSNTGKVVMITVFGRPNSEVME